MKHLLIVILAFIIGVYVIFASAYVTHIIYGWFVLRYYPNLPHFTVIQIAGFGLVLESILPKFHSNIDEQYKEDMGKRLLGVFIVPWLTLAICWVFYTCFVI